MLSFRLMIALGDKVKDAIAILGILVIALAGVSGCSVSDGSRAGVVTKFSRKGRFSKSYEGELVLGGIRSHTDAHGNSSVGLNTWEFSVLDEKIAGQVRHALRDGSRVELEYHQTLLHNPFERETSYIVTAVNQLEGK